MIAEVTVVSEETQEFNGKRGHVKLQRLVVLDMDPKVRFKQTFDYDLEEDERDKYAGKLVGKKMLLGITDFLVFGGRFRARGKIQSVVGESTVK